MTHGANIGETGPIGQQVLLARWLGEVPIYASSLLMLAGCVGLLMAYNVNPSLDGVIENARIFMVFAVVLAVLEAVWQLYRQRPQSPFAFLGAHYSDRSFWQSILAGLPLLMIAITILPFFSKMKAAIPLFNDYVWDDAFIRWDQAIFFGYDAWQVLQPMIGFPIITAFLAFLYHLWFVLLYPGVMFFAFGRVDHALRRQFFLTYTLSWVIVGGLMATLLASVGPCFVEPLLGNPRFADQMAYLNAANEQVPVMTLNVQALLLEWQSQGQNGLGSGITAMPSMHCAIAFLYWIAVRRIHRGWGAFFGLFFIIIWVSSVHLAYHYAVDGLVSLIAVAVIWAASGRIIAAWDIWVRRQPTLRTNTVPAE